MTDPYQLADAELAHAPAGKVVEWAVDRFGKDLVLAASFQDVALIDLAVQVDRAVEVDQALGARRLAVGDEELHAFLSDRALTAVQNPLFVVA